MIQKTQKTYSLDDALAYYGFAHDDQKKALKTLFAHAGIITQTDPWHSLFPIRTTASQLADDILTMVTKTQAAFTLRHEKLERWEIEPSPWMTDHTDEHIQSLSLLGFTDALYPRTHAADIVCILGSTREDLINRIAYTNTLIEDGFQAKMLVLLTGERLVTKNTPERIVDGTEEELSLIAREYQLDSWQKVTETHLMLSLYNTSPLPRKQIPCYTINTPARSLPRPNTLTTISELLTWLQDHPRTQNILFISDQPLINYQYALIRSVFHLQKKNITLNVVGPAIPCLDVAQPILDGLAAYLWAVSPLIFTVLKLHTESTETRQQCTQLYGTNPTLYAMLPESFRV